VGQHFLERHFGRSDMRREPLTMRALRNLISLRGVAR